MREFVTHFPRERGMLCHTEPHRKAPGSVKIQRERGQGAGKAFVVVFWEGMGGAAQTGWTESQS